MNPTDSSNLLLVFVYAVPMLAIWLVYFMRRRRREELAVRALAEAKSTGLTEPASLHPVIDPTLCLGCATCVSACPEGEILGLVSGKAVLVSPSHCIGHGACKEACPQDAIRLVLGTEKRGVEVPVASPTFETNVPGLFVAGEIGGMGLIRNAIAQGTQAMDAAAAYARPGGAPDVLDVLVVGAGPAGLAASLRARELGLRFRVLEQESFGGTVAHYPRGKIVMTAPAELPGYGTIRLRETSKEALLDLWQRVIDETELEIATGQRVTGVQRAGEVFEVATPDARYRARAVVLCIGRRGTPRRLGVQGEALSKVVYRLVDPEQYAGRRVLVVGGGDSAVEAALAIAEQPGSEVTLCYRGDAFSRAKPKNRARLEAALAAAELQVMLGSSPVAITPGAVRIALGDDTKDLANDAVIVCVGGVLPTGFLREAGIEIEVRHGE